MRDNSFGWFWYDLLEILVEEYWICPFCGSNNVAECWDLLCGRFRDGRDFGPYAGTKERHNEQFICDDCNASWETWSSPWEWIDSWSEWEHKGKMIKL